MDMYRAHSPTPECFRIDDLLNFSNDDLSSDDFFFSSAATTSSSSSSADSHHQVLPPLQNPFNQHHQSSTPFFFNNVPSLSYTDFAADLCLPSDDIAELEWLSQFVDESFNGFPSNELTGSAAFKPNDLFPGRARSKRSKPHGAQETRRTELKTESSKGSSPAAGQGGVRMCTHCASEKTPQWRTGPLGPKTLCNACGVRYKSGRLVPEYRPAASPTFVLTQHSNSHRKVMELRRQKELLSQQQQQEQIYHNRPQDFRVW